MVGVLLFCSAAAFAKPELSYNLPLPGGTLGNEKLQYDTLMPVYTMAQIKVQDCQKYSVTDTKVTKQPYDLKTENLEYDRRIARKRKITPKNPFLFLQKDRLLQAVFLFCIYRAAPLRFTQDLRISAKIVKA